MKLREGFISLGLNLTLGGLPLLPMVMMGAVYDIPPPGYAPVVSVVGVLVANAIDIGLLSREKVQVPFSNPRGARTLLPSSVALMPMLNAQQRGIALVGQF